MSMFPHTVTIYNASRVLGDKYEETLVNDITILRGVLVIESKGVNVRKTGLESADAVDLHIPFSVEAVDGVTGQAKQYVGPMQFWRTEDRTNLWTLSTDGNGGETFFVKGEVVEPDADFERISMQYDGVYTVTKVDAKDFGTPDMQHWEVGGA